MNLLEIVEKYRLLYRNMYMKPTLEAMRGSPVRLPVSSADCTDFEHCRILVDLGGPVDPHVWACNNIDKTDDVITAMVVAGRDLADQPIELRKFVLAHEWLEVMYFFCNGKRLGDRKISKKTDIVIMYEVLKRRCPWQDSADEWCALHLALRALLVSNQSLEELLAEPPFSVTVPQFRRMATTTPQRAAQLYEDTVSAFAAKWSVRRDLAGDRLDEVLFDFVPDDDASG